MNEDFSKLGLKMDFSSTGVHSKLPPKHQIKILCLVCSRNNVISGVDVFVVSGPVGHTLRGAPVEAAPAGHALRGIAEVGQVRGLGAGQLILGGCL